MFDFSTPATGSARTASGAAAVLLLWLAPAAAVAQDLPRVVIVDDGEVPAAAGEVADRLRGILEPLGVEVDVHTPGEPPATSSEWTGLARRLAAERPATLAVAGWLRREDGSPRALVVVEPVRGGLAEIPLAAADTETEGNEALARTLEAGILGELLPELRLLAAGSARPAGDREPADTEEEPPGPAEPDADGKAALLFIGGGYTGEYPHPQERPIHGPFLWLSVPIRPWLLPTLGLGWLGIERAEDAAGEVSAHRLPASLSVRLRLEVGAAAFAAGPAARLDTVFVRRAPAEGDERDMVADLELHVGGLVSLHLPLPGDFEVIVGAAVLATVMGDDYGIDGERILSRSAVRLSWLAGLGWNLGSR